MEARNREIFRILKDLYYLKILFWSVFITSFTLIVLYPYHNKTLFFFRHNTLEVVKTQISALGAFKTFLKIKAYNYFLHVRLWREKVTFAFHFFKYIIILLNDNK